MTAAACDQHHQADGNDQNTAWLDKITQSHKRFLTINGPVGWARKRGSIPDAPTVASSAPMSAEFQVIDLEIPPELAGQRLDSALARLLPQHSRTRIKGWIEEGAVLVGRQRPKPRDLVEAGAHVRVQMNVESPKPQVLPEAIALRLV